MLEKNLGKLARYMLSTIICMIPKTHLYYIAMLHTLPFVCDANSTLETHFISEL